MQPDANDIVYTTYGFNTNIFKVLIDSLFGGNVSFDYLTSLFLQIWTIYSIFAFLLSAIFIVGIIYAFIRASEMGEEEEKRLHDEVHRWKELHGGHVENNRLQSVQVHLASSNPNDWKLAIIEADVLLERTLEKAGYIGVTIGDKLKNTSARP